MKTEKNILIAFLFNIIFSLFELFGGIFTRSVAIISDAIHDFGDSISVGISYILEKKSKKGADNNYTYGYVRYSLLGAVLTNTILITGSVLVLYNSIIRILNPVEINYNGMIIFAIIGVLVNFFAAYFTRKGDSLNQKAVNLHMLEDVLGWLIVLIGAVIIKFTNLSIIDPIMSIIVALYIVMHAGDNFKSIIDIFLEKTTINIEEIKNKLSKIKNIEDVHHIHVWSLDGLTNYATMHVVIKNEDKKIKEKIRKELLNFNISHVTLELENKDEVCGELKCFKKSIEIHKH